MSSLIKFPQVFHFTVTKECIYAICDNSQCCASVLKTTAVPFHNWLVKSLRFQRLLSFGSQSLHVNELLPVNKCWKVSFDIFNWLVVFSLELLNHLMLIYLWRFISCNIWMTSEYMLMYSKVTWSLKITGQSLNN